MLKSDATLARKTMSAPDGNPVLKDRNKRTQVVAGFLRQRDAAEPGPEHAIVEGAVIDQTPSQDTTPAPEPAESGTAARPAGEIELKLLVDADRMAHFNAAPVITANARNKGTRKHLKSVYYDTAERLLRRNGLSLRVRQSGARFVQTVKTDAADDPLRRGEWEASVSSLAPDLALAMPFIPEKLRSHLVTQPLEAVFTADIRRHARMIDLPSGTVEIAFDQGELTAGNRTLPVSEIELELKSGSASTIYEVALRLAEQGAVKPSIRTKSARGFDLAADEPPTARRPRKLRLDASVTLDEAFATILRSCFLHLLQSLPAAEDGRNPEGVHQLRVSLRRLRSALDLMRSVGTLSNLDALRSEVKWLAQDLSAARDWDVFQLDTLPTIAQACPLVAGFDALGRAAAERQSDAYRKAHDALDDRRCAVFLIGLGNWIETRGWRNDVAAEDLGQLAEPAVDFARRILSEQYAKVLKRGRRFKSLPAEELHRVRLATKRLRYLSEFLLPLYEDRKSARRFSRRLAALQEELGAFNDMAVTASLLDGLGTEPDSAIAAAAIAGWQARASIGVQPALQRTWRDFTAARVPWSSQG
ncbi:MULTISPECIES: CYTH and CHAD domain-containing protein [Bradyrhizobium]|uniref:CYTH and CHAD domain-containing protein n=1 Tax=Bradyrhizobium TaxID=374 RepID=UPI0004890412|nr:MULTISPECIES: CYTH and CHAD domain-containing protein [Bradyrhizobium]MBR0880156.1 CHAD domain-containing protein [Bradyrhizobium liaoningense]MBR0948698.1 CHAD domain-containing protein [Bradyrhizobium liaoningense]MBR1000238.1 CHAD domain-containing protein [Bradyrhizobium liaoningense]MBR1066068.1 CHAD domain-containing protein [Bradyrhizobium liaoningense]MDI2076873.1 CHAD domain-containing protein [Bradyrhizobium sp. Mp27]